MWIRIRILNTDPDRDQGSSCGSGSTTLRIKHQPLFVEFGFFFHKNDCVYCRNINQLSLVILGAGLHLSPDCHCVTADNYRSESTKCVWIAGGRVCVCYLTPMASQLSTTGQRVRSDEVYTDN